MSGFTDAAAIVTAATAVAAVVGGYVQFVLKRSVLPSADFAVEFTSHFLGPEHLVGEGQAVVKIVGTNMLIVTNVRYRAVYRLVTDADVVLPEEPTELASQIRRPGGVAIRTAVRRSRRASLHPPVRRWNRALCDN